MELHWNGLGMGIILTSNLSAYTQGNFIKNNTKSNGFGTVFVSINGLQNGAHDGNALVDKPKPFSFRRI
jgi:hypothetical protein